VTPAVALVTGAGSGIGRACVERLAAGAARVAAVDLDVRFMDGLDALPLAADVSDEAAVAAAVARAGDELGPLDAVVNVAGITGTRAAAECHVTPGDEWRRVIEVNLTGPFLVCHAALPGMLERGRGTIVNNASISGYAYFPAASTYAASKAGVVALTESLRRELDGTGVRALHVVTPGVNTDMLDATEEVYGRYMDTSGWDKVEPEEWARKVLAAVEEDKSIVGPGGKLAYAKLASRGPAFLVDALSGRMFSRQPRR
jgi:NAD(P)-dependent dehydrogenase (short-subunit alcohol dehydrogenase family)